MLGYFNDKFKKLIKIINDDLEINRGIGKFICIRTISSKNFLIKYLRSINTLGKRLNIIETHITCQFSIDSSVHCCRNLHLSLDATFFIVCIVVHR